jgi:class 3 adenylate cyclase
MEGARVEDGSTGRERSVDEAVAEATGALRRGSWTDAYRLLIDADRAHGLTTPDAITMLAQAAYLTGNLDAATRAFERLHTGAIAAGDQQTAAAAAGQISFMLFDALMFAPSRAWLRRAERLIEAIPDSPIHATTTNLRAWHALVEGDYSLSLRLARESAALADRTNDRDTATVARVAEARTLIAQGEFDEGLAVLDETSVAAVSGELSPVATGLVYCMANCAYQSVSDYERAEQWTQAMERWSARAGVTVFQGRCRVHRAQLKRLRGEWREAAAQVTLAGEEMGTIAPPERGWALSELGLIRLRLGDLQGAEAAFLEALDLGWQPQPGLSLLRLAEGKVPAASGLISDALEHAAEVASREVPPSGALRRAPMLAAQVEIAIAAGDVPTAAGAVEELESIASIYRTRALRATAVGSRAALQLATGEHQAAMRGFEAALATWQALDAPYEAARARMGLAEAARASGNEERAGVEYRAALRTFERLEAVLDARRASAGMPELAAKGPPIERARRTFMFTDIVRSTNLVAAIGDQAWRHLLRWHGETVAGLISTGGGTIVDTTGDGFFAAFDSERDAVESAVAIQRTLRDHRQSAGFAPQIRIGLHAAEADTDGTNWSGIEVHAAARIGALAEGEEIVASRSTATAAGLAYVLSEPRSVSLKGISQPLEVVTVAWE